MRYPLQPIIAAAITGCLLAVAAGCVRSGPPETPTPAALAPTRGDSAGSARPSTPAPAVPPPTLTPEPTSKRRTQSDAGVRAKPPVVVDKEGTRPPQHPTSSATVPDLGTESTTPSAPWTRHRVEAGDTIYWLAEQYGTSPEAILHANGLDEQGARSLDIGQELVIPIETEGDGRQQATPIVHQVQAGETLGMIAQRYGTTVETLMAANDLEDAELILAGQELVVPVSSGTAAPGEIAPAKVVTATAGIEPAPAAELVALEAAMVAAVNVEREARGLPPYRVDDTLATVARAHAQDMVTRDYTGHTSPEGKRVRDRLRDAGLDLDRAGENYYVTTLPAEEAVAHTLNWFMGDPPHRNNILHAYYTRFGVGVAYRSPGWYIFVLDFAGD